MSQQNAVSTIALKTFPLFSGLSDDVIAAVARHALMRRFPRGQTVVRAGDRTDYVYFVLTGSLKVVVSDEDGREVILSILGQGELFGEMGMFGEQPRSASVVAVVAADLVMIAKHDFRELMQDNFEIAWRIMCNLAERLRNADRKIESLALMDVYGRVAGLLLEMSEDVDGESVVVRKISKQDIAKMIGASREMVSRVMKDLGQQGLIEETPNGIILRERLNEL
ncbi:cyclic nucleotide-binding domain-containing protein [Azoarcus communis]|jgi:CRP/FNR family cyclic AMP-dependent transcriptional regulator|uniref:Crp/Fnr family transcriptional regulator n=1 Tax=Parazoarcus communis SWub3 = DSM 12120 TaxID=1121029 RepID=A0A323UW78_9RHOO|nr:cyclic nucleotide-binding domain-containing protein [Parazoarcus communis]NMG47245.1 cyclic nucleotide-binding domain-containing protein [Parazoarcus communis]NMG71770.1 cyclic nucleotide-binding domain-containing protein [Parazoarcus communis SWub3 = DSM 12120]PZA17262.1 Crp/Fnr family transcriptional regulator [Azoarcus communis] [Parazoarcus communis SWub3 = DSM 12120]